MPNGKARYRPFIGKRPHFWSRSRYSQLQKRREEIRRHIKRQMLEQGTIENKVPLNWEWRCGEKFGTVTGFTRSEIRSKIKQILSLPKKKPLPGDVQIRKVQFNEFPT